MSELNIHLLIDRNTVLRLQFKFDFTMHVDLKPENLIDI